MDFSLLRTLEALLRESRDVVVSWFAIVTRRERVLEQVNLGDGKVLLYALRFLLYMTAAELIIRIPATAARGIRFDHPGYIVSYVAATYVELLGACLILHLAMKIVGGRGDLRSAVSAFCFLTAFLPILWVFFVPVQLTLESVAREAAAPVVLLRALGVVVQGLSAWEQTVMVIAFLAATATLAVFFVSVFEAFRGLHRLGRRRALAAFVLGLAVYAVFLGIFVAPFFATIEAAFGTRPGGR